MTICLAHGFDGGFRDCPSCVAERAESKAREASRRAAVMAREAGERRIDVTCLADRVEQLERTVDELARRIDKLCSR